MKFPLCSKIVIVLKIKVSYIVQVHCVGLCKATAINDQAVSRGPSGGSITNHGLYGSTSCYISHWPQVQEMAIFDPPQLENGSPDFDET